MTFDECVAEIKKIPCEEKRAEKEDYTEVVVARAALVPLTLILESYFGPPLKPEGKPSSKDADRYTEPYGGILSNQTLYFRRNEKGHDAALLWPWGNGASVTVKIIREK